MCCSVLQCAEVCCSVLQCGAVCCSMLQLVRALHLGCCSALQFGAVCCRDKRCIRGALQHTTHCNALQAVSATHLLVLGVSENSTRSSCSVLQCVAVCYSALQCVAVCCSVLKSVALCCIVFQCVAVYCSVLRLQATHLLAPGVSRNSTRSSCSVLQSFLLQECCSCSHTPLGAWSFHRFCA